LPQKPPIPSDLAILAPDPSLPDAIKALTGKWSGEWGSRYRWKNELYIEKIEKDSAEIVLSWGEFNHACHCAPAWKRQRASIQYSYDQASLEFNSGKRVMYFTLNENNPNEMQGIMTRKNKKLYTTMKKVE
jgi:hypothetical protein